MSVNVSLLKASAAQLGSVAVDWVWKVFGIGSVMASMGECPGGGGVEERERR